MALTEDFWAKRKQEDEALRALRGDAWFTRVTVPDGVAQASDGAYLSRGMVVYGPSRNEDRAVHTIRDIYTQYGRVTLCTSTKDDFGDTLASSVTT